MLRIIIQLKHQASTQFELFGWSSDIIVQNRLILDKIHPSFNFNQVSRTTASNTTYNMMDSPPYLTVGIKFLSLNASFFFRQA